MKILKKDLKNNLVTLKIENPNDVWTLEKLITPGDMISGKTLRRVQIQREETSEKAGKKPMWLKIEAEKIEFHETTGKLRITGRILEGPEEAQKASYHTFVGEEGAILTIEKNWKKWQLDKIKKSFKKTPDILLCLLDERRADFSIISEKIKEVGEVRNPKAGKDEYGTKEYFGKIIPFLESKSEKVDKIVIAGPGFTKEDLYAELKEKTGISEKVLVENVSHTGKTGIQEAIKRGIIERVMKESRLVEETKYVEEALAELGKDGLVTYGKGKIEEGIEFGAVKTLLVSESVIKENEDLIEKAEKNRAKVVVVSDEHEAGEKLLNFGGLLALLRFKIE